MNNPNIINHFLKQAALHPTARAIQWGKEQITYAELLQRTIAFKQHFEQQGIEPGMKLLILHPISIDLYAALLALLAMGATLVFVEEWTGIKDIALCQRHIGCDAIICNTKIGLITLCFASLRKMRRIKLRTGDETSTGILNPVEPEAGHPALISFSSGSSGAPKVVIRTHQILYAQFEALRPHIPLQTAELICTNFPVVILLNLGLGLSTFISKKMFFSKLGKTDFDGLYEELKTNRIACLACSPFVVHNLALNSIAHQKRPLPMRAILSGGAPFFPAYADAIYTAFPNATLTVLYGSSEAEPIAYCHGRDLILNRNKPGLPAGKIDPHTLCKIGRIEHDVFIENEIGIAGEIVVSGAHVVTEYYHSDEALAQNKIVINQKIWHRTGDFGYFDLEQNLFLTGHPAYQEGAMYLFEMEKQLAEIPGISNGTILKGRAYIETQKKADKRSVAMLLKQKFPALQEIIFTKLPFDKRHHGKIRYREMLVGA